MPFSELIAVSPIDGRYASKTETLREYFSEYALVKYRVCIELEYLKALSDFSLPEVQINVQERAILDDILKNFSKEEAGKIKAIEATTNHDVKAVEYYIREKFHEKGLQKLSSFIHFGLTSQDINNTAIPLSIKDFVGEVFSPLLDDVVKTFRLQAKTYADISMLSRTHGQAASPTKLGKEFLVFIERIEAQRRNKLRFPAKFSGATGNFNAHAVSYPEKDWKAFGKSFVEKTLGLHFSFPTTQIEHYDGLAEIFDTFRRINVVLIDFCRDIWTYIMLEYFTQKKVESEVGSSAMPHKVNPIDFENAEGNLLLANSIFDFLSNKLPVSRLQRDLTDSTVLRNVGVPFGYTVIAFQSLLKGLKKLSPNTEAIAKDLEKNYAVVAEAIQTVLRKEGVEDAYEKLKTFSRGKGALTKEDFQTFISSLEIRGEIKKDLLSITPENYTGIA